MTVTCTPDLLIPTNRGLKTSTVADLLDMSEQDLREEAKAGHWHGAFKMRGSHYVWFWEKVIEVRDKKLQGND